jgi:hypothetical protein
MLVVSKGDERLVDLGAWRGWHFPQDRNGQFPGYYPPDSAAAIHQLEDLRSKGADFLLFPSTSFWWLEHYQELAYHLNTRYSVVIHQDDTCLIYALREMGGNRLTSFLNSLLPPEATVAVVSAGNASLLDLDRRASHFPRDASGTWAPDLFGTGAEAATELERVHADGADYLIVPKEASSWLERYPDFMAQVRGHYREVAVRSALGAVYDLGAPPATGARRTGPAEGRKPRGIGGLVAKLFGGARRRGNTGREGSRAS